MRSRAPLDAAVAFLLLVSTAWGEAAAPAPAKEKRPSPSQPTFSERMSIREVEILVERPPERRMPKASDLKVSIDGRPQPVVRVERASDDAPWSLVLYLDRELASPGTLFFSLLALAEQADALTQLGSVEVLDAGSGRPLLEPTRDARALRWTLGDFAAQARLDRDRFEAGQRPELPATGLAPLTLATASRRLDRLVARLAQRRPTGPHALFLIADGSDPKLAPPFERAARLLSGYAWVTFPVLVRKELRKSDVVAGPSELEVFRRGSDFGSKNNMSIPPILPNRKFSSTTLSIEGVVELLFDPEVAGFRALARETAGAVIGREAQLAPALDRLGRRMRVWIDESDPRVRKESEKAEETGRLQRLDVVRVKTDLPLRASTYLRASTPEELTATRLRLLLEGEELRGDFELKATWSAEPKTAGASGKLDLTFDRAVADEDKDEEAGPVRVTWGWIGAGGELETHSRLYSRKELKGKGTEARFARSIAVVVPAGAGPVGVVADDLATEQWGGDVVTQ